MYQKDAKEIIKEERKNRNLTQEEVAKKLKIDRKTYNRYEQGINKIQIETLIELAKLYEVTADYLLGIDREIRESYKLTKEEQKIIEEYRSNKNKKTAIDIIVNLK